MSTDVVDGTAVDLTPDAAPVASLAIARQRRSEVIRPLSTDDLVESFQAYQQMLPRLLDSNDYQGAGGGKEFVKKSGWRKIAAAFDLDVIRVSDEVERDADGLPIRATAIWRAIAPSGRAMEGDGYCSVEEDRFKQASSRKKLENDLRATATTRAKNRAISDLVGMGAVSAEEVSAGGHDDAPSWTAPASDTAKRQMLAALEQHMGHATAVEYAKALAQATGGHVPDVVAQWVGALPMFIAAGLDRAAAETNAQTPVEGES